MTDGALGYTAPQPAGNSRLPEVAWRHRDHRGRACPRL